jgi:hypothetical protein
MGRMNIKAAVQRKKKRLFSDRERECEEFRTLLKREDVSILNIYGVGGVGKSTLLGEYISICQQQSVPVGLIDGKDHSLIIAIVEGQRVYSAIQMLDAFVQQFCFDSRNNGFFKAFRGEVRELNRLIAKLERASDAGEGSDGTLISTGKEFMAQAAGGIVGAVVGNIPGAIVGAAIGTISEQIIEKVGRTVDTLKRYKLSKEDIDRCLRAEHRITSAFVQAVNRMANAGARKIILMFDTYEEMGSIDAWLRNSLLPLLHTKVAVVIAGRDPLSDKWNDWIEVLHKHELHPFAPADAELYLAKRGVTKPEVVRTILTLTNGLPWALTLVTEINNGDEIVLKNLSTTPSFGRQVVERFFSQVKDDDLRDVIEACSLPLTFDADLLAAMLGTDVHSQMRRLQQFSFVEEGSEGRFCLNDTFREFVFDRLRQERPSTMLDWNQRALKYYQDLLQAAPRKDFPILVWNYLHHTYFGDEEAHDLLVGPKIRKGLVEIRTATPTDLQGILQVDWAAFPFPEDRFQIEQITDLYRINSDIFTIAREIETGEILGYSCVVPMKREFALQFEAGTLDIQDVLAPTVLPRHEDPPLIDYMLDSLVLRNHDDLYIGALLIRYLGRQLTKARKLYSIVSSDYGRKLMSKLKFRQVGSLVLSNNVVHDFYASCLYDSKNPSPVVRVLPKEPIPMQAVCDGCLYTWCYEWGRHVKRAESADGPS